MIIKSYYRLIIGETVYTGYINNDYGEPYAIPFQVRQQVTKEDYIRECKEQDKSIGIILDNDYFYRVSID